LVWIKSRPYTISNVMPDAVAEDAIVAANLSTERFL